VPGGILVPGSAESATAAQDVKWPSWTRHGDRVAGNWRNARVFREGKSGTASVQGGNVLVLSADALITDGARSRPGSARFRSTVPLMTVLNHLDTATRPE